MKREDYNERKKEKERANRLKLHMGNETHTTNQAR